MKMTQKNYERMKDEIQKTLKKQAENIEPNPSTKPTDSTENETQTLKDMSEAQSTATFDPIAPPSRLGEGRASAGRPEEVVRDKTTGETQLMLALNQTMRGESEPQTVDTEQLSKLIENTEQNLNQAGKNFWNKSKKTKSTKKQLKHSKHTSMKDWNKSNNA